MMKRKCNLIVQYAELSPSLPLRTLPDKFIVLLGVLVLSHTKYVCPPPPPPPAAISNGCDPDMTCICTDVLRDEGESLHYVELYVVFFLLLLPCYWYPPLSTELSVFFQSERNRLILLAHFALRYTFPLLTNYSICFESLLQCSVKS